MRRWNGWGDDSTGYPLPASAAAYLSTVVDRGSAPPDVTFEQALAAVPGSRLPDNPLYETGAEVRLRHACGQSLPDWVALRSGRIPAYPDGVAYPASAADVRAVLDFTYRSGVHLIPYGGGTSVVGHVNPLPGGPPSLTVDFSRLDRLETLDETSRLATFGAGVSGPALERQLAVHGYTLGHFPQSFELSTLGGWIATRSSGQQSYHYGRIEALFAGGQVETPQGMLELPLHPASAAGPDLRQLILGCEGRLGLLTSATVRIRPQPEFERFYGVFFPDWETGSTAVRAIVQAGLPVSMLRLSDAQETETTLVLSGKERLVGWASKGLGWLGYGPDSCLLVYGVTGSRPAAAWTQRQVRAVLRTHHGLFTGGMIGRLWEHSRFRTPYLRNTLWERGYALDTLETAVPWSGVLPTAAAIKAALQGALAADARVLVFAHLSHVYPDGASLYVTYLFPRAADPAETLHRWQALKGAGSRAVVAQHGTISHQHGVGCDHALYLPAEKGPVGMALLDAACRELDPQGLLNPGKLLSLDVGAGVARGDGRLSALTVRRGSDVG